MPYVHVPSKTLARQSTWLTHRRLARLYQSVLNPVFDQFQPHWFIVDSQPLGALRDLEPYLRHGGAFNIFIHRASKPESLDAGWVQAQRLYRLVVAPHLKGTETIPVPPGIPLYWSGPLWFQPDEPPLTRAQARQALRLPPDCTSAYLTLGGGGDSSNSETLDTLRRVLRESFPTVVPVFGIGPLAQPETWLTDEHVLQRFPASSYHAAFDFAVSAAGYNSFHELLSARIPTLFIPRERGYDDQLRRAETASQAGACLVVREGPTFIPDLVSALHRLLNSDVRARLASRAGAYVPHNHADELAEALFDAWGSFGRIA